MLDYSNHDLRRFHAQLADKVQIANGTRCPCCGHPMVKPRKRNATSKTRRDLKTVAHNRPVGFGGDPTIWVYACQGCNNDQKNLTFRAWSMKLAREEDKRADRVAALADVVDTHLREGYRARSAGTVQSDRTTA